MRIPIIAGNWKMHKTILETKEFLQQFCPLVNGSKARILIAPPFLAIPACVESVAGTRIEIGAQTMHEAEMGAFTGEVSAKMIKEAGASFVLLGHSERRHYFGETNKMIDHKVKRALSAHLLPILCIGETEKEREAGETNLVLQKQLSECLESSSAQDLAKIVIAYEPVWAIGTGKTATPQIAQEAHLLCRTFLEKKYGKEAAQKISILYGGSVKADTISALMDQPDIDGALVGGASLDPKGFAQIVNFT